MSTSLMTLREAATRYDMNPTSLRKAANRRTLTAERKGRDWLVTNEEVESYLAHHAGRFGRPPRISDSIRKSDADQLAIAPITNTVGTDEQTGS
jgi:hypothetical protein